MATFTQEIEFEVICSECGNSLNCDERESLNYRRERFFELKVDLCEKCRGELQDEIEEKNNEMEKIIDDYDQQITDLYEQIDALQTELTYNKLKNKEEECTSVI